MAHDLNEREQELLMEAAWQVIKPYWIQHDSHMEFEGETITIKTPGIDPKAPPEVQALAEIYQEIIERRAFAASPEMIAEQEEPA